MIQVLAFIGVLILLAVALTAVIVFVGSGVVALISAVEVARTPRLLVIALRSLVQHRLRSSLLISAIAIVTALLLAVTSISTGIQDTLLTSATTLMSGHVNVCGFYKVTGSQSAPVVTNYRKIIDQVKKDVPEVDYVVQRGRGWAKLVSDTGSMQVGIGGIDILQEPGFRKVIIMKEGKLEDLAKPDGILLFEEQADKLGAKTGDKLTVAAPTFRGTNNTVDVTVVGVAQSIGMLSSWNTFMNDAGLRRLYQLNDETTGAIQIYLHDVKQVKPVQERLRSLLGNAGFSLMDPDPRPFWMKFDSVNRESWTGQKLDITNWEDETAFVQWLVKLLSLFATFVIAVLVMIIAVGIMIVVWISIRERTREIGTLRAIGMQRQSVLAMFVTEGFLMGALGTAVGTVLGLLVTFALGAAHVPLKKSWQVLFMSDHLVVTPTFVWLVFGVIFITGAITSISVIPSFVAARMKPISAMSHVG